MIDMHRKFYRCLIVVILLCGCVIPATGHTVNAAQTELMTNGGFESGLDSWIVIGNFYATFTNYPHSGTRYAYLSDASGNPGNNLYGQLYQQINIPSSATSASLTFWYNISTNEIGSTPHDFLLVTIRNSAGSILTIVDQFDNTDAQGIGNYSQKSFNMTPYIGQTVRVDFTGTTNASLETVFRIDDVSVVATSTELPDLIVEDIQVTPDPPIAGSSDTTMSLTIRNQGSGNAAGQFFLDLYFDDVYQGHVYLNDLGAGATYTSSWYAMTWPSDTNLHTIRGVVDSGNAISESNEGNNERSEQYSAVLTTDIILTLYIHEGSASGLPIVGAQVTGQDAVGNTFNQVTNSSGYVTIAGTPGTWQFTVSQSGYRTNSWSQPIIVTETRHAYLIKDAVTLTLYVHDGNASGPIIAGAQVTGQDAAGNPFSLITNPSGYVTINGIPGTWQFSAASSGYETNSWAQLINISNNKDAYLVPKGTTRGEPTEAQLGLPYYNSYEAEPVNTVTGNYVYKHTDLRMPGIGLELVFQRTYNSNSNYIGALGYGWTHTYNVALSTILNPLFLWWEDGHVDWYSDNGDGTFTSLNPGVYDVLVMNPDESFTLTRKDQIQYNFDSNGYLISISDRNDNTVTLSYEGNRMVSITDTTGRLISFTYDASDRITRMTDPMGRQVDYTYDGNGDLVGVSDALGNVTAYAYNADHRVTSITLPEGNILVSNTYDTEGRVETQCDGLNNLWQFQYDTPEQRKTTVVDPEGYQKITVYDSNWRTIEEVDANGDLVLYAYDDNNNRTQVTDKRGHATSYIYDERGNVLTITDSLGNTTTYTYNNNNDLLSTIDALGNATSFVYDINGNLSSTTDALLNVITFTYTAQGQVQTSTDASMHTTNYYHDSQGNLTQMKNALNNLTTYTYDTVGRKITETDANNHTRSFNYDANDRLLIVTDPLGNNNTYTYDDNGNQTSITDKRGNVATYAYDDNDRIISETDKAGGITTYTYDGVGNQISQTDPLLHTSTFAYDGVGNLIQSTDALGKTITNTYDPNGNMLTTTNANGHTTQFIYDVLDRQTSIIDPLENTTTKSYDAMGRLIMQTDARGKSTTFSYDALGRLIKVTEPGGGEAVYSYDGVGNLITLTNALGNSWSRSYDAMDQLTSETDSVGNTISYDYDPVGNQSVRVDADADTTNYSYDANNRHILIRYPDTSEVSFSYDASGNVLSMTDPTGTTTYQYDEMDRVINVTDSYGKVVQYTYDLVGNQISITYPNSQSVLYTYDELKRMAMVTDWLGNITAYNYDDAGNLISSEYANGTFVTYGYDSAERLTALENRKQDSAPIATYAYTLDPVDNHLSVAFDEPLDPLYIDKSVSYTYDQDNRIVSSGTVTYTHDSNGNLTSSSAGANYTWDYENRLIQTNGKSYIYNGIGQRVQAGNTRYVLDVSSDLFRVLAETDTAGNEQAYCVHGLGLISKIYTDESTYWFHGDSRGSVIAITDESENIVNAYSYSPFGELLNQQETIDNPFKFVGLQGVMDESNGLYFMRARYYDSTTGRFLSKDTFEGAALDPQTLDRYVYVTNNPIILVDPMGLEAICIGGELYYFVGGGGKLYISPEGVFLKLSAGVGFKADLELPTILPSYSSLNPEPGFSFDIVTSVIYGRTASFKWQEGEFVPYSSWELVPSFGVSGGGSIMLNLSDSKDIFEAFFGEFTNLTTVPYFKDVK